MNIADHEIAAVRVRIVMHDLGIGGIRIRRACTRSPLLQGMHTAKTQALQ